MVGKADKRHVQGKLPVAYVVIDDVGNKDAILNDLFENCKKELPEYEQPSEIKVIDSLPQTPIGKIDYRKLEELATSL